MKRNHTPEEIRVRAIQAAIKKYDEGCINCSEAYLKLARANGASADEIHRAGFSRRGFMRFAGLVLAAGVGVAAGTSLLDVKTARAAVVEHLNWTLAGSFGVDSCTPPEIATVQSMPLQFYIAELGGTNSVGCFIPETSVAVGADYTHGYWGLSGPNLSTAATPFAFGQRQAEAAVAAWQSTQGVGGLTLFADVEEGYGGWSDGATQKDMAAVLDGFLTGIAAAQFVPGAYIGAADRDAWFPSTYLPAEPFVYWVAGGPYAGVMCPPCMPDCDTLSPVFEIWNDAVQQETFGGQGGVIWQYWISNFGCSGDYNYSPQPGYQKFVPAPPCTIPVSTPPLSTPTAGPTTPAPTAGPTTPAASPSSTTTVQ
ncbi:MAG: hypothetical protein ACLQUY_11035 [Ktedonobacterales bacterium]